MSTVIMFIFQEHDPIFLANILDSKELLNMDRMVHIWTFCQKYMDRTVHIWTFYQVIKNEF